MKRLIESARLSLLAIAVAAPAVALAQDPDPAAAQPAVTTEDTSGVYPLEFIKRPNTLFAGMVELRLDLNASLTKEAVFKPFAIAPSVFYGIDDKLQVGLVHTDSLCLASEENGCDMVYKGGTLDGQYNFLRDAMTDINAHAQVDFNLYKDGAGDTALALSVRVGAFGSILFGEQLALYFDPQIKFGLTKRDEGNKEAFAIPLRLAFQATPSFTPFAQLAFGSTFEDLGDNTELALGVGLNYAISNLFDVYAVFSLDDLLISDLEDAAGIGAADRRSMQVGVAYRFGGVK